MSAQADAARERRWKARGHARLTSRISGEARNMLTLLSGHYGLSDRLVVQGLLLAAGAHLQSNGDTELLEIMREHRMSLPEAQFVRHMHSAQLQRALLESTG